MKRLRRSVGESEHRRGLMLVSNLGRRKAGLQYGSESASYQSAVEGEKQEEQVKEEEDGFVLRSSACGAKGISSIQAMMLVPFQQEA